MNSLSSSVDSILEVWNWGSKAGAETVKKILHSNCNPGNNSGLGLASPITGINTEPIIHEKVEAVGLLAGDMPGASFVRLAGLSGALAISLGAYGAHVLGMDPDKAHLKTVFDTANKYHLLHSAALLAIPNCRKPRLTGSLMVGGMLIFCGSTYYHALTEDTTVRKFTPYGGMLLILGWLSLIL